MDSVSVKTALPISDYAIVVNPQDNVAVVKTATERGLFLTLSDGKILQVRDEVPPGHRFATREIPAGGFCL